MLQRDIVKSFQATSRMSGGQIVTSITMMLTARKMIYKLLKIKTTNEINK
jgi:hypothetical protein